LTWQFAALQRYLDVPLIGLQSPSLSGLPAPASLAALAASHADRIAALYPAGPIRLLGWSFGGALALCLAAELRSRGRTVSFVGMLDTRRPLNDSAAAGPAAAGSDPAAAASDPAAPIALAAAAASNPAAPIALAVAAGSDWAAPIAPAVAAASEPGGEVAALLAELGFEVPAGTSTVADAVALIRASDDPVAVLTDAQIALVVENYLAGDRLLATATYPAYAGPVFFVDAQKDGAASTSWTDLPGLSAQGLPVAHSEMLDPATLELLGPLLATALED
jgi:thioesterase domain-containing protein